MILNYEILAGFLILVQLGIIILTFLHKLYVASVWKIINKLLSKETAEKYEKFKKNIEKVGITYLILLIIINVGFILINLFMIIYANVELSNNLDDYINVHLNMKQSVIMLLVVKSNLIIQNNSRIILRWNLSILIAGVSYILSYILK